MVSRWFETQLTSSIIIGVFVVPRLTFLLKSWDEFSFRLQAILHISCWALGSLKGPSNISLHPWYNYGLDSSLSALNVDLACIRVSRPLQNSYKIYIYFYFFKILLVKSYWIYCYYLSRFVSQNFFNLKI